MFYNLECKGSLYIFLKGVKSLSEMVKVLVCDDSLLIRKQVKSALEKCGGFEIYLTGNGEEAVNLYKENRCDLVLLDLVMPKVNGLESLRRIKEIDAEAKVIIITSTAKKENLQQAIELGAVDFIQKPLEEEKFIQLMGKYKGEC